MSKRALGSTTHQMINAPVNSVYVWLNSNLLYPRSLAKHLGRGDLIIRSCNGVFGDGSWRGVKQEIIVDHSTYENCSNRVYDEIMEYKLWKAGF